jgi:hypothetical protein
MTHNQCIRLKAKQIIEISRCLWDGIIKMDLKEIWYDNVNWIHVAQNRDRWYARLNLQNL